MKIMLGQRLKELRLEKNMTQQEVASALNLHSVTYLHYETDQREPYVIRFGSNGEFFWSFHRLFIGA